MLYVFHVDAGRMMKFDMTVALSSVENLKITIERLHNIPADKIVLLISGGEMLAQSSQVSCYSAGTDTNPIYMFLTEGKEPLAIPDLSQSEEEDERMKEEVERCINMPPVFETVVVRTHLAIRLYEMALEEQRISEKLIHDQHLQQQGWSAAVANIEDLTLEFRQRFKHFCIIFDQHFEKRPGFIELLTNFKFDLIKLSKIPILPGLLPLAEQDFHGFDQYFEEVLIQQQQQQHQQKEEAISNVQNQLDAPIATANIDNNVRSISSGEDKNSTSSTSPSKKLKLGTNNDMSTVTTTTTNTTTTTTNNTTATTITTTTATTTTTSQTSTISRHLNLLQWITSRSNNNTLNLMAQECIQGLGKFTEPMYEQFKLDVKNLIEVCYEPVIREVRGLSDRLCRLEELKYSIKATVKDQEQYASSLQQNQSRAMSVRDASILPDLCASHQSQLSVMLINHLRLRENTRLITRAKCELGSNLYKRLIRIVGIENKMSIYDTNLLFNHRCLRRAERHLQVIEQIHQAPTIYIAAVTEVVRRKIFSGEFCHWASKLATDFDLIHSEEVNRRQLFNTNFDGHFLNTLFPGMHDMPPLFANQTPLNFDTCLPHLTKSDIDMLSTYLPDIAEEIQLPNMEPVLNFFITHSGSPQQQQQQPKAILNTDETTMQSSQNAIDDDEIDDKDEISTNVIDGCEIEPIETDDAGIDFEKLPSMDVGETIQCNDTTTSTTDLTEQQQQQQQMLLIARSTLTEQIIMQNAETVTDENALTIRNEIERLRHIIDAMSKISLKYISMGRNDLQKIRTDMIEFRNNIQSEILSLKDRWTVMHLQLRQCMEEKEMLVKDLLKTNEILMERNNDVENLKEQLSEKETLRIQYETLLAQMEEWRDHLKRIAGTERNELIQEQENNLGALHRRFTNASLMECSQPFETNREGATSNVLADLNLMCSERHEEIITELRNNFEKEKNDAINAAIEAERTKWQEKLRKKSQNTYTDGILQSMLLDKEQQLGHYREKDLMLTKENYQLKSKLNALTNDEGNSWLKEKIDYLNRDKVRLEEELNMEKSRRADIETSFAAMKNSTYSSIGGSMRRSQSSCSSQKYIVLDSCRKGDMVCVVWSILHCQFMVVQDSQKLCFVHADSLPSLNLYLPNIPQQSQQQQQQQTCGDETTTTTTDEVPIPRPYYAIGLVTEKEYCQARKDTNRYRVPKGSKFYRIKIAPLTKKPSSQRDSIESYVHTVSRSHSQSEPMNELSASTLSAAIMGGGGNMTMNIEPAIIQTIDSNARTIIDSSDITDSSSTHTLNITTATANKPIPGIAVAATSTSLLSSSSSSLSPSLVNPISSITIAGATKFRLKERTVSITSVTEEDDEPSSLLSDHCRYASLSEEEELSLATNVISAEAITSTTSTSTSLMRQKNQSVITEQPTASSNKFHLELLLAATDIKQQQQLLKEQQIHESTCTLIPSSTSLLEQQLQASTTSLQTTATAAAAVAAAAAAASDEIKNDNEMMSIDPIIEPIRCSTPVDTTIVNTENVNNTFFIGAPPQQEQEQQQQQQTLSSNDTTTSDDSEEFKSLDAKTEW